MDLNTIWFLLIGILLAGYAILDGFDFGVGILHLFTKNDNEKRVSLNSIGPVWDGNEVWLITGGGALFAAFPIVYATVFSGFYLALMALLVALIIRAVSIEFRSKVDSPSWKRIWDFAFGIGSLLPPVLLGVAVGNIIRGVPINVEGMFTGSFLGLLNPFALLLGIFSLILFTMHGAIYLTMKTEGEQKDRAVKTASMLYYAVILLYVAATIAAVIVSPFLFSSITSNPLFWFMGLLLVAAFAGLFYMLQAGRFFAAFISSSLLIVSMFGLFAISLFPRMVPSLTDLNYSLTIYNASSTPRTLQTMLIIALVGMPFVIGYTVIIYRVFKGKVILEEGSSY